MAKDKPDQPTQQLQPLLVINQTPTPPEPIPDFDKTVPGGRFKVEGRWVDAYGKPIPEGQDAQDPEVLAKSIEKADDLSLLTDPDSKSDGKSKGK